METTDPKQDGLTGHQHLNVLSQTALQPSISNISDGGTLESLDRVIFEMEGGDAEEVKDDGLSSV